MVPVINKSKRESRRRDSRLSINYFLLADVWATFRRNLSLSRSSSVSTNNQSARAMSWISSPHPPLTASNDNEQSWMHGRGGPTVNHRHNMRDKVRRKRNGLIQIPQTHSLGQPQPRPYIAKTPLNALLRGEKVTYTSVYITGITADAGATSRL